MEIQRIYTACIKITYAFSLLSRLINSDDAFAFLASSWKLTSSKYVSPFLRLTKATANLDGVLCGNSFVEKVVPSPAVNS